MKRALWTWISIVILVGSAAGAGFYWIQHVGGTPITSLPAENPAHRPAGAPPEQGPLGSYSSKLKASLANPSTTQVAAARKIIDQLDDADGRVREAASLKLNSLDGSCLEVVEAAAKDPAISPEQQVRLQKALFYLRPRAKNQKIQLQTSRWIDEAMHKAYATHERQNAPWNEDAHHAIDLMIQLGVQPLRGPAAVRTQAIDLLTDVLTAGCDDPFIRCLYGMCRGPSDHGNEFRPGRSLGEDTHAVMADTNNYPPYIKLFVNIGYLFTLDQNYLRQPGDMLPFRDLARQADLPPGMLVFMAKRYGEALLHVADIQGTDMFCQDFQKYASPQEYRVVRGTIKNNLGNARRGHVGNAADEDFAEALQLAEEALKADPSNLQAARLMMTVKGNLNAGSEEIETWFQRAAECDPDAIDLYIRKLNLFWEQHEGPNASEAAEQMIDFGRQCLATQNWRGGIPTILVEAHRRLADDSLDRRKYLAQPEVWRDISAVYEGALLNFPDDTRRRSEYAKLAAQCGKWDIAQRQFERLGEHADLNVFVSRPSYEYLRRKAKRLAVASQSH
jgi:tetratricopeptide (TPR) repeat protein